MLAIGVFNDLVGAMQNLDGFATVLAWQIVFALLASILGGLLVKIAVRKRLKRRINYINAYVAYFACSIPGISLGFVPGFRYSDHMQRLNAYDQDFFISSAFLIISGLLSWSFVLGYILRWDKSTPIGPYAGLKVVLTMYLVILYYAAFTALIVFSIYFLQRSSASDVI